MGNRRQQKRTFCCNPNKYKNKNTQLLNLSSNSAIFPNMFFMVPKCALGKFLLAATFLDINFVKIVRKRGGGYAQV